MQTLNTLHRNNKKKFPALLPDHSSLQILPVISMIRLGERLHFQLLHFTKGLSTFGRLQFFTSIF